MVVGKRWTVEQHLAPVADGLHPVHRKAVEQEQESPGQAPPPDHIGYRQNDEYAAGDRYHPVEEPDAGWIDGRWWCQLRRGEKHRCLSTSKCWSGLQHVLRTCVT